jgi:hypothetical protein
MKKKEQKQKPFLYTKKKGNHVETRQEKNVCMFDSEMCYTSLKNYTHIPLRVKKQAYIIKTEKNKV